MPIPLVPRDALFREVEGVQPEAPAILETVRASDFCATDIGPIDYLVPPFVVRGGMTIPYGPPKVGKTTLTAHCVTAMLDPTFRFLDGAQPLDGAALWIDLEQPRRVSQRRFAEVGAHPDLHIYRGSPPTLAALLATIDTLDAKLLVVDSLSRWLVLEDENDNAEANRRLAPILVALQERDITSIVIAHANKTEGGAVGKTLRGASAFSAAADIVCEVKAEGALVEGRRRLCFMSREEVTPDLVVRLDATTKRYVLEGTVAAVKIHEHTDKIAKGILYGHKRKDALADYLNISEKTLERWIAPLVRDGTVRSETLIERGAPLAYSLTDPGHFRTLLGMSVNVGGAP